MLVVNICMVEACMSWNGLIQVVGPVFFSCYLGLEKIFAWTTAMGPQWRGTQC